MAGLTDPESTVSHPPTIVLIGPRGAGKSTIGRLLASTLNVPFADLDDRVRARFGNASVSEIWRQHGEAAFRAAEAESLAELLESSGTGRAPGGIPRCPAGVLSLGGGTPMIDSAQRTLTDARARGVARVVLLLAPPATLAARLRATVGDRPSLTGDAPHLEVEKVLAARLPTYIRLADARFDTSLGEPGDIAARLVTWVREQIA